MKKLLSELLILVLALGGLSSFANAFDPARLGRRIPGRSYRHQSNLVQDEYNFSDSDGSEPNTTKNPANSTVPGSSDLVATTPSTSDEVNFQLSRNRAIHIVLRKVLQALGPKFEDSLPSPTNATLTPFIPTIKVLGSEACPDYYKRCSSQTFYPSCEIPRNTDEQMWNQRFTLYFNISSEISTINRRDVLNATLRLYKNLSLPLNNPRTLIVRLHAFGRSLRRNRERSKPISLTKVASDYVGWVFLDVRKLIRRLKGPFNYGIKITVKNENDVPWNIPDLFVKMDCQASNETLIPLPFEVMQLENETQRYPALNIRSGSLESIEDDEYYDEIDSNDDTSSNHANVNHNRAHTAGQTIRRYNTYNNYGSYNQDNPQNSAVPILPAEQDSPRYYGDDLVDEEIFDVKSPNIWSTNDDYEDRTYRSYHPSRSDLPIQKKQTDHSLVESLTHPTSQRRVHRASREHVFDQAYDDLPEASPVANENTNNPENSAHRVVHRIKSHRTPEADTYSVSGHEDHDCKEHKNNQITESHSQSDHVNDEPYPDYTEHSNRIHTYDEGRSRHNRRHFRRNHHRRHHSRRHHGFQSHSSHHDRSGHHKTENVIFDDIIT